jgi:hypothetical protein
MIAADLAPDVRLLAMAARPAAGRIIALVLGGIVLLGGLGFIVAGGALLWADRGSNRVDGYLFSEEDVFSSGWYAVTSEELDLASGADWLPISRTFGSARIDVTATGDAEIFVGVAPVSEAAGYLRGMARTVVDDLGPRANVGGEVYGGPPKAPPGDQTFWTAQASGPGTQQLTWEPEQGHWILVVMNADGSAGISVVARVGATFPSLTGLAWGLLIGGGVALLIAVLLLSLSSGRAPEWRPPARPPARPASTPRIPAQRSEAETPVDSP